MTTNSVFCIAFSRIQADQMVIRLKSEAFSVHDISILSAIGPMNKVRLYESRVKEGHTLFSVYAETQHKMSVAMEIFSKAGGTDICTTEEPMSQYHPATKPRIDESAEVRLRIA